MVGTNMREPVSSGFVLSDNKWVWTGDETDSEESASHTADAFRAFVTTTAAAGNVLTIDVDSIINPQETVLMGDVNNDGLINIVDVSTTINYLLGNSPEGFSVKMADMNGDGFVNISDVTSIISIILNL